MQVVAEAPPDMPAPPSPLATRESRGEAPIAAGGQPLPPVARPATSPAPRTPAGEKIGRNDPCYCGSGKKYKKCCYLKGG
jgi:preprotein translocase subunit SecA